MSLPRARTPSSSTCRIAGIPGPTGSRTQACLRREMGKGRPIRDASVDPATGKLIDYPGSFLNAERNLLRDRSGRTTRRLDCGGHPDE
jgi:hypothetical protein